MKKETSKPVIVWIPNCVMPVLDSAVAYEDTDRSKFIRKAIRELLVKRGFTAAEDALLQNAE